MYWHLSRSFCAVFVYLNVNFHSMKISWYGIKLKESTLLQDPIRIILHAGFCLFDVTFLVFDHAKYHLARIWVWMQFVQPFGEHVNPKLGVCVIRYLSGLELEHKLSQNAHPVQLMLKTDGWMDGARMWHAYMTSFLHVLCAILVEKKNHGQFPWSWQIWKRVSHWLWMLSVSPSKPHCLIRFRKPCSATAATWSNGG